MLSAKDQAGDLKDFGTKRIIGCQSLRLSQAGGCLSPFGQADGDYSNTNFSDFSKIMVFPHGQRRGG